MQMRREQYQIQRLAPKKNREDDKREEKDSYFSQSNLSAMKGQLRGARQKVEQETFNQRPFAKKPSRKRITKKQSSNTKRTSGGSKKDRERGKTCRSEKKKKRTARGCGGNPYKINFKEKKPVPSLETQNKKRPPLKEVRTRKTKPPTQPTDLLTNRGKKTMGRNPKTTRVKKKNVFANKGRMAAGGIKKKKP